MRKKKLAKLRVVMFDLVFIVFDSANLSLAFDTLYDIRWSCRSAATAADFRQKHIYVTNHMSTLLSNINADGGLVEQNGRTYLRPPESSCSISFPGIVCVGWDLYDQCIQV
jgi:hypothetical protein